MKPGTTLLVAFLLPIPFGVTQAAPKLAITNARLEVLGPTGCIPQGDLASRVLARSQRIRFMDDGALSAQVSIDTPRPGTVIAEIVMASSGSRRTPRRVIVRSCAEAVDAVALILTVALDPTFASRPANKTVPIKRDDDPSPSQATDAETSRTTPYDSQSARAPQATSELSEVPRVVKAAAPTVPTTTGQPPLPTSPVWGRWRFGAHGAVQSMLGPAPTILPGFALYGLAGRDRDSLWSPAVQIGFARVWRSDLSQPGGTASFRLDSASLDVCVLRVRSSFIEARVCASVLGGMMVASGAADMEAPSRSTRFFGIAGGAILVTAGLGETIEVSTRLGMGATLIRDSYELTSLPFHRADALTTSASFGLGARWR